MFLRHHSAEHFLPVALIGFMAISAIFVSTAAFAESSKSGNDDSFLADWSANVARTQEAQPYWVSLLGMSSPRLTQGFRYDYARQYTASGTTTDYGMGKGLQLIIAKDFELQIGVPAYIDKQSRLSGLSGWADEVFLGRYRFISANEESGNYIVSGSLGISIPTGGSQFSSHETMYSPTLAAGKGWGTRQSGFSIQTSLSASVPDNNLTPIGVPVVWSTAFQAHITRYVWPEIETSYTHWCSGPYDGKNQLVLTYGIVFGRFEIEGRKKLALGLGYQEPVGTNFSTFA